ncbi:MAG: TMEM43 family protein [Kiritimatiellia bacterium]
MAVTETTTESWGSRLGNSIKGVLVGLGLFIAAFPVLFWNEGNSVKTAKALAEGEGACMPVASNAKIDAAMEGKLVHMSGLADTKDELADDDFGVKVTAIGLIREVEMYQWVEESHTTEKKNVGGSVTKTTTYTYTQKWTNAPVDSSGFKEAGHDNPGVFEFPSSEKRASNVTFGAFRLSEKQISRIGGAVPLVFDAAFTSKVARVAMQGGTILVPNRETRDNSLNRRDVAAMPRIGDMRVTFKVVRPHEISLVAKQHGDTFIDYTATNGKKISLLTDGVEDAVAMFASARSANAMTTWLIRLAGLLMMYAGLSMVLKPLSVVGDVLPFIGNLLELGNGLVAGVVSFVCTIVTIAIAWLFYRPVLGVGLLVAAGALVCWLKAKAKNADASAKPAAQPPAVP